MWFRSPLVSDGPARYVASLRKQGVDPLWNFPSGRHGYIADRKAEERHYEAELERRYPPRSLVQQWRDRRLIELTPRKKTTRKLEIP